MKTAGRNSDLPQNQSLYLPSIPAMVVVEFLAV